MSIEGSKENLKKQYYGILYEIDRPTPRSAKKGIKDAAKNRVLNEESIRYIRQAEGFTKEEKASDAELDVFERESAMNDIQEPKEDMWSDTLNHIEHETETENNVVKEPKEQSPSKDVVEDSIEKDNSSDDFL